MNVLHLFNINKDKLVKIFFLNDEFDKKCTENSFIIFKCLIIE